MHPFIFQYLKKQRLAHKEKANGGSTGVLPLGVLKEIAISYRSESNSSRKRISYQNL